MCGGTVAENGATIDEIEEGFECTDCGEVTCRDCKSIGVARDTDHCKQCRG